MFNERVTDYIEAHFKDCLKSGNGFVPCYYPHIQDKQKDKVLNNILEDTKPNETILMVYDTSLFNRCKNGLVITDKAVYFKDMFSETLSCKFCNWRADRDETKTILDISEENAFILSPFLDKFITGLCEIKNYEGLFDEEEKELKELAEEEEKKAPPVNEKNNETEETSEEDSEDEDDDSDEDSDEEISGAELAVDLLGIALDIFSDPD